eukprot:5117176-Prorocentrum_lima.AAC.1
MEEYLLRASAAANRASSGNVFAPLCTRRNAIGGASGMVWQFSHNHLCFQELDRSNQTSQQR